MSSLNISIKKVVVEEWSKVPPESYEGLNQSYWKCLFAAKSSSTCNKKQFLLFFHRHFVCLMGLFNKYIKQNYCALLACIVFVEMCASGED